MSRIGKDGDGNEHKINASTSGTEVIGDREDDEFPSEVAGDNEREVPREVDFFSVKKSRVCSEEDARSQINDEEQDTDVDTGLNLGATGYTKSDDLTKRKRNNEREVLNFFSVKKSRVCGEEGARLQTIDEEQYTDFDTGLNLGATGYIKSPKSGDLMIDRGEVSEIEFKRVKNELAKVQDELKRVIMDNQNLSEMFTQLSNSCNSLVSLMQQQQTNNIEPRILPRQNIKTGPVKISSRGQPCVSIRVPLDAPINDECNWKQYATKKTKGNPDPRRYYSCSSGADCAVTKMVQQDGTILINRYKGNHNHSLSPAAEAFYAMFMNPTARATVSASANDSNPSSSASPNTNNSLMQQQMTNLVPGMLPDQSNFSGLQFSGRSTLAATTSHAVADPMRAPTADPNLRGTIASFISSLNDELNRRAGQGDKQNK